MKTSFILVFPILFISFFFVNFAGAQTSTCPSNAVCIENPLKATSFEQLINSIINFLFIVVLALGSIMIVLAGYYFVTAAGDPAKIGTAKKIILYTLVGIGVVVFSKAIMSILREVLGVK